MLVSQSKLDFTKKASIFPSQNINQQLKLIKNYLDDIQKTLTIPSINFIDSFKISIRQKLRNIEVHVQSICKLLLKRIYCIQKKTAHIEQTFIGFSTLPPSETAIFGNKQVLNSLEAENTQKVDNSLQSNLMLNLIDHKSEESVLEQYQISGEHESNERLLGRGTYFQMQKNRFGLLSNNSLAQSLIPQVNQKQTISQQSEKILKLQQQCLQFQNNLKKIIFESDEKTRYFSSIMDKLKSQKELFSSINKQIQEQNKILNKNCKELQAKVLKLTCDIQSLQIKITEISKKYVDSTNKNQNIQKQILILKAQKTQVQQQYRLLKQQISNKRENRLEPKSLEDLTVLNKFQFHQKDSVIQSNSIQKKQSFAGFQSPQIFKEQNYPKKQYTLPNNSKNTLNSCKLTKFIDEKLSQNRSNNRFSAKQSIMSQNFVKKQRQKTDYWNGNFDPSNGDYTHTLSQIQETGTKDKPDCSDSDIFSILKHWDSPFQNPLGTSCETKKNLSTKAFSNNDQYDESMRRAFYVQQRNERNSFFERKNIKSMNQIPNQFIIENNSYSQKQFEDAFKISQRSCNEVPEIDNPLSLAEESKKKSDKQRRMNFLMKGLARLQFD